MDRRSFLYASMIGATGTLSGCVGSDSGWDSAAELAPSSEVILDSLEGPWSENDTEIESQETLRGEFDELKRFVKATDTDDISDLIEEDPTINAAGRADVGISLSEDAETAQNRFEEHRIHGIRPEQVEIGTQSVAGGTDPPSEPPQARVLFRDRNAIAWISYWNLGISPDNYISQATWIADQVYEHW